MTAKEARILTDEALAKQNEEAMQSEHYIILSNAIKRAASDGDSFTMVAYIRPDVQNALIMQGFEINVNPTQPHEIPRATYYTISW